MPTRSASSCAPVSATKCTIDWSTRSSAASTPPTPTASASPRCRSSRHWRTATGVCCSLPDVNAVHRQVRRRLLRVRCSRRRAAGSVRSFVPPPMPSRPPADKSQTDAPVTSIDSDRRRPLESHGHPGRAWTGNHSHDETFDAVVFATPAAAATATAIADTAPDAATLLGRAETADVIMVTLHVTADQWPERLRGLSGYLVPKPDQRWVTAASFASQKWGHWRPPAGGEILRVSIGRDGMAVMHLDDDEVLRVVLDDLDHHLGVRFTPAEVRITRWPAAFAQYRPHHAAWVDEVEAALPSGVLVIGAGFRGIGIPACVRAATSIAARASTIGSTVWQNLDDGVSQRVPTRGARRRHRPAADRPAARPRRRRRGRCRRPRQRSRHGRLDQRRLGDHHHDAADHHDRTNNDDHDHHHHHDDHHHDHHHVAATADRADRAARATSAAPRTTRNSAESPFRRSVSTPSCTMASGSPRSIVDPVTGPAPRCPARSATS